MRQFPNRPTEKGEERQEKRMEEFSLFCRRGGERNWDPKKREGKKSKCAAEKKKEGSLLCTRESGGGKQRFKKGQGRLVPEKKDKEGEVSPFLERDKGELINSSGEGERNIKKRKGKGFSSSRERKNWRGRAHHYRDAPEEVMSRKHQSLPSIWRRMGLSGGRELLHTWKET